MINFVVSDLETALVPNGEKMVQEETIELIMELKEKGVYFAVATGRNYDAVYPMFGKAKDHIVYICNDGGSVIYRDKVISKTPLDRLVCLEVANELEKNGVKILGTSPSVIDLAEDRDLFRAMMEKLEIRGIHKSDIRHGFLRHTQRQLLLKILIRHIFYFHSDSILGVIEFQCKP